MYQNWQLRQLQIPKRVVKQKSDNSDKNISSQNDKTYRYHLFIDHVKKIKTYRYQKIINFN